MRVIFFKKNNFFSFVNLVFLDNKEEKNDFVICLVLRGGLS